MRIESAPPPKPKRIECESNQPFPKPNRIESSIRFALTFDSFLRQPGQSESVQCQLDCHSLDFGKFGKVWLTDFGQGGETLLQVAWLDFHDTHFMPRICTDSLCIPLPVLKFLMSHVSTQSSPCSSPNDTLLRLSAAS